MKGAVTSEAGVGRWGIGVAGPRLANLIGIYCEWVVGWLSVGMHTQVGASACRRTARRRRYPEKHG